MGGLANKEMVQAVVAYFIRLSRNLSGARGIVVLKPEGRGFETRKGT
jgi:hypothetical protein